MHYNNIHHDNYLCLTGHRKGHRTQEISLQLHQQQIKANRINVSTQFKESSVSAQHMNRDIQIVTKLSITEKRDINDAS